MTYSKLCKRAGLPAPTGLAPYSVHPSNGRYKPLPLPPGDAKKLLKVELDKMVATGAIKVTADGRYFLP